MELRYAAAAMGLRKSTGWRALGFVAERALERYVIQPRRVRELARKRGQFVHRADRGKLFELDPAQYVDRLIFVEGIYERRFLELLAGRFPPGAVALDIGANIGNHAIYLSDTFAQIHCFEPNPEVYGRLKRNIELNKLDNVHVHTVGMGNEDAVLRFSENLDGNLGASGFVRGGEDSPDDGKSRTLELPIKQADRYIESLGLARVDFIKVDVEGMEPDLFEGLRETIARHRPIVAFEYHGQYADAGDYDRIRACLPGYAVAEPVHASPAASLPEKLLWNMRHAGRPILARVDEPEARTYENLIAFPSDAVLRSWQHPDGTPG